MEHFDADTQFILKENYGTTRMATGQKVSIKDLLNRIVYLENQNEEIANRLTQLEAQERFGL